MIIITRQLGESVLVTGLAEHTHDLNLAIIAVHGSKVRLGLEVDAMAAADLYNVED